MHELMDSQTVRDLLGVKERQFRTYVNEMGLPSQGEGRDRRHNWPDVLEWWLDMKIEQRFGGATAAAQTPEPESTVEDIRSAMLRKTRAEANLKELALSKQRGEVVTVEDVKTGLDRMMGNLRARLLGLPPKLASRLEGTKARTERETSIREEIEAVCRDLSTGAVVDLEPEPEEETAEIEASAASEGLTNLEILANLAAVLEDYAAE